MKISFLYRTSRQFMSLRAAALGFWRRGNLPLSENSPDNRRLLREDRPRNDICTVMKISPLPVGFDTRRLQRRYSTNGVILETI